MVDLKSVDLMNHQVNLNRLFVETQQCQRCLRWISLDNYTGRINYFVNRFHRQLIADCDLEMIETTLSR